MFGIFGFSAYKSLALVPITESNSLRARDGNMDEKKPQIYVRKNY